MSKINILGSGSIEAGMWIVCYEATEQKIIHNPMTGEVESKDIPLINPWFKGVPWFVTDVAGPIIAVKTWCIGTFKNTPIVFFDARLCKFLQVDNEFGENYVKEMKSIEPPTVSSKVNTPPSVFSTLSLEN